ncbi:MAG: FAD-binding oxidoreductase [Chloroflexi bacterium]|nr:FAD-binding oxidoreductase [Chloroflexota bacterium]
MKNKAEVVVVGGGVMGCSILYNLARRGVTDALLVEREALGAGSTGRSSGVVRMHYSSEVNARLAWKSLEILRNFGELVGGDSGFVNTGFMLFVPPEALDSFEKNIAMQQSIGIDTRIVSQEEAREIAPYMQVEDAAGICYEPQSGYADPPGVGQGYAAAARDLGAQISLENPALDVEVKGGRVAAVLTAKGRIETDTAVIAAGPWTGRLMKKLGFDLPLTPTRHEVIFLKRSIESLPTHPVVGDLVHMVYFRPEGPDLTLIGDMDVEVEADPDEYDQKAGMDFVEEMWPRVVRRLPALEEAEYFTGYAGLYTNTPDGHPIIDRVEGIEGLYICTGFNGHGFKESPAVGIVVSELMVDGEATTVDISTLGMGRFKAGTLNPINYAAKVIG